MRKSICVLFTLLLCCCMAGCGNKAAAPTPAPVTSEAPVITFAPSASPGVDAPAAMEGTLQGYEEGKQVPEADAPLVSAAIKAKYPDAKITGITYATHEDQQVYHVTLSGGDTAEVYVDSVGNVLPYTPAATAAQ